MLLQYLLYIKVWDKQHLIAYIFFIFFNWYVARGPRFFIPVKDQSELSPDSSALCFRQAFDFFVHFPRYKYAFPTCGIHFFSLQVPLHLGYYRSICKNARKRGFTMDYVLFGQMDDPNIAALASAIRSELA